MERPSLKLELHGPSTMSNNSSAGGDRDLGHLRLRLTDPQSSVAEIITPWQNPTHIITHWSRDIQIRLPTSIEQVIHKFALNLFDIRFQIHKLAFTIPNPISIKAQLFDATTQRYVSEICSIQPTTNRRGIQSLPIGHRNVTFTDITDWEIAEHKLVLVIRIYVKSTLFSKLKRIEYPNERFVNLKRVYRPLALSIIGIHSNLSAVKLESPLSLPKVETDFADITKIIAQNCECCPNVPNKYIENEVEILPSMAADLSDDDIGLQRCVCARLPPPLGSILNFRNPFVRSKNDGTLSTTKSSSDDYDAKEPSDYISKNALRYLPYDPIRTISERCQFNKFHIRLASIEIGNKYNDKPRTIEVELSVVHNSTYVTMADEIQLQWGTLIHGGNPVPVPGGEYLKSPVYFHSNHHLINEVYTVSLRPNTGGNTTTQSSSNSLAALSNDISTMNGSTHAAVNSAQPNLPPFNAYYLHDSTNANQPPQNVPNTTNNTTDNNNTNNTTNTTTTNTNDNSSSSSSGTGKRASLSRLWLHRVWHHGNKDKDNNNNNNNTSSSTNANTGSNAVESNPVRNAIGGSAMSTTVEPKQLFTHPMSSNIGTDVIAPQRQTSTSSSVSSDEPSPEPIYSGPDDLQSFDDDNDDPMSNMDRKSNGGHSLDGDMNGDSSPLDDRPEHARSLLHILRDCHLKLTLYHRSTAKKQKKSFGFSFLKFWDSDRQQFVGQCGWEEKRLLEYRRVVKKKLDQCDYLTAVGEDLKMFESVEDKLITVECVFSAQ